MPDDDIVSFGEHGSEDAFDRRVDGVEYRFDEPAGAALAQRDLQGAVTALSSSGAHVVVLTAPYYRLCCPMKIDESRSPMNEAWVGRYNQLQLDVTRRNPTRASLVDLNLFLDPAGTWTDTVNGVKVRSFDRSHLSEEGADLVGNWLIPQLLDRRGQQQSVVANTASPGTLGPIVSLPPAPAYVAART